MDYYKLVDILEQRNHYEQLKLKLESDIDFKNAVLENDLDIKERDKELFLEMLFKGFEDLISKYEQEINKILFEDIDKKDL